MAAATTLVVVGAFRNGPILSDGSYMTRMDEVVLGQCDVCGVVSAQVASVMDATPALDAVPSNVRFGVDSTGASAAQYGKGRHGRFAVMESIGAFIGIVVVVLTIVLVVVGCAMLFLASIKPDLLNFDLTRRSREKAEKNGSS